MEFPNELIDRRHDVAYGRVFTKSGKDGAYEDGSTLYIAIGDSHWWSAWIYVLPNGDVQTLGLNGHLYYSGKVVGNEIVGKTRSDDARYIATLPAPERESVKRHIVYTLKKRGGYSKENVAIAMKGRVCDVY